jgi:hypothetical protein
MHKIQVASQVLQRDGQRVLEGLEQGARIRSHQHLLALTPDGERGGAGVSADHILEGSRARGALQRAILRAQKGPGLRIVALDRHRTTQHRQQERIHGRVD